MTSETSEMLIAVTVRATTKTSSIDHLPKVSTRPSQRRARARPRVLPAPFPAAFSSPPIKDDDELLEAGFEETLLEKRGVSDEDVEDP